jgi:hypothetical protein
MSLVEVVAACLPFRRVGSASAPHQLHDRRPDIRRQAMPRCDKLAECRALPAYFRPGAVVISVSIMAENGCGNRDASAIPAASTSHVVTRLIAKYYVYNGRG